MMMRMIHAVGNDADSKGVDEADALQMMTANGDDADSKDVDEVDDSGHVANDDREWRRCGQQRR